MLKSLILIGIQTAAIIGYAQQTSVPRKNVLMIMIDDLRPELGCYGNLIIESPNIDKLASQGTQFDRAYCQHAICAASRTSLLTSTRPEKTGMQSLDDLVNVKLPNAPTIPKIFKANGYETIGYGKIYHSVQDDESSYVRRIKKIGEDVFKDLLLPQNLSFRSGRSADGQIGPSTEAAEVGDYEYKDGKMTKLVLEELQRLKEDPTPNNFFLTVGFMKPHLPFTAPKKYWELYNRNDIIVPPKMAPEGLYANTLTNWQELRDYSDIPNTPDKNPLSDAKTKELIHGYYASVSYIDFLIGEIINKLDVTGLRQNTIVVLVSDHGLKLGDYGDWCKHTTMEVDNRVPLIISAPGLSVNKKSLSPVELLDIFPTLTDLCNIPTPNGLEGVSLKPILKFPSAEVRSVAVNSYNRSDDVLGMSVRSAKFRYTEWRNTGTKILIAKELFDYENNFILGDNISGKAAYTDLMKDFSKLLTNVSAKTKTEKIVSGFENDTLYKIKGIGDEQKVIGVGPAVANTNRNLSTIGNYKDDLDQLWQIKWVGDGWHEIISATTGKLLSLPNANSLDGAPLIVQNRQNLDTEKWKFQEVNDKSVIIRNKANQTKVINISRQQTPAATSPLVLTLGINETPTSNSPKFFIYKVPRETRGFVTSVDNDMNEENLVIYPNPSQDGVFSLSQSADWKVTSVLGVQLKAGKSNQINISEYPKGIYLIETNEKVQRVVIE